MSLIDKAYFTLGELEERWNLPHRDLAYLAENGLLRLSVRLFGVEMEFGVYEECSGGEWFTVPHERRRFTGFQACRSAMSFGCSARVRSMSRTFMRQIKSTAT
jgi:hypothetical protein